MRNRTTIAIKEQLQKADGFAGELSIVVPDAVVADIEKNPVIRSLFLTDIGYYPHARHHFRSRDQGVEEHILIYSINGEGFILMGDRRYHLKKNHFFVIPEYAPHAYGADEEDPWSIYWLHFKGERSQLFKRQFGGVRIIEPTDSSRIEYRINLFREMIYCLGMGFTRDNLEYVNLCLNLLLATFFYVPQFRYFNKRAPQDLIEQIILHMRSNVNRRMTLKELSNEFEVSVPQLSKLFQLRTHKSPIDYFIHLKVQRACQLLDFTNLRIKTISMELGYDDPYYFSRLFKRIMGVSPSDYRERDGKE